MYGTVPPDTATSPGSGTGGARGGARLPLTPARRAALVIGVPVCLLLIASTGMNLAASLGRGSFPVSYAFPAGTTNPRVTDSGGDLLIKQAAVTRAQVTGTARYSLVRPHITTSHAAGGGVTFGYDCVFPFGSCGLDATLTVPPGQSASAATDGGNATVSGTAGAVTVSTGGGDISADHASGPLTLRTDGGNVTAAEITAGVVAVSTGGGDITVTFTAVPSDVHVTTDGGGITLILPPGPAQYHVTASTAGGTVTDTVPQNTSARNVITATSGGGDITIRQPGS